MFRQRTLALGRLEQLAAELGVFAHERAQVSLTFLERVFVDVEVDVDVAGAGARDLVVAWAARGGAGGRAGAGALEAVGDDFEVGGGAHEDVACDGAGGGRVEGRVWVDERRGGRDV